MNPFLDSQAQRNTPRGWLCRCLPKTLFATSKAIEIKSALSARPADALAKTDPELSRAKPEMVEKRVQSGGCGVAALVEPHTAPIAARSSTGSRFCTPLQPPGTIAALAPPPRASQSSTRCCRRARPPRQRPAARARTEAALAAAAHAVHIPPRSRAPTASAGARCTYRTHGRHVKALGRGPTFC